MNSTLRLFQQNATQGGWLREARRQGRVLEWTRGGGFSWSEIPFGYSISGTTVTIYAGEVQYQTDEPKTSIETTRTISSDNSYIAVEFTYKTRSIAIGSATTTKPCSEAKVFRKWLWRFRLAGGVVYRDPVNGIGNMSNIHI